MSRMKIYGVIGFVLIIVIGAIWWYWYFEHSAAVKARESYDHTLASYDCELATTENVCRASAELCHAEQCVPFSDPVRAQALHVIRLWNLETRERERDPETTYGSEKGHLAAIDRINQIAALRNEALDKLDELLASQGTGTRWMGGN